MNNDPVTLFGKTNFRSRIQIFGIKRPDRRYHMYILGKTGMGKSSLLEAFISQDLQNGEGLALLDPHGDLAENVLARVPEERQADLIYFDVGDRSNTLGFNPLEQIPPEYRSLMAGGLLKAFEKMWSKSWGVNMEHILRNALYALLDYPGATLADILRLLRDKNFRTQVGSNTSNVEAKEFWLYEFGQLIFRQAQYVTPVRNKVGALLADPHLYQILTQPKSSFDIRQIMDEGKILIVNLAKGRIGEDAAGLFGALIASKIEIAALSRVDTPEEKRRDFYLYLDEFPTFTTKSLATMLAELRKYRTDLILVSQSLSQIDQDVRDAIFGNVGTIISFQAGVDDARVLERVYHPAFSANDIINLPKYNIYLKMAIDGSPSKAFSAEALSADALDELKADELK